MDDALVIGVWGARAGTLAAAAAASAAYTSLVVTEFRGFRQFGVIGGIGMFTAWLTAFVLVPPLVKGCRDHDASPRRFRTPFRLPIMVGVTRLVERAAPAIVALAGVLAVLSTFAVSRFDSSSLEYVFSKLRRSDTWAHGEGYIGGARWTRSFGHYLDADDHPPATRPAEVARRRSARQS